VIGPITSERGAVVQDIRATVLRRFPHTILLWPVPGRWRVGARRRRKFDALAPGGGDPWGDPSAGRADRGARRRHPPLFWRRHRSAPEQRGYMHNNCPCRAYRSFDLQ